jgi:hypothetical protein
MSEFDPSAVSSGPTKQPCECPECGHRFQGQGWDGIDAHWKAKHEAIMPYAEAWPLIRVGKYRKKVTEAGK